MKYGESLVSMKLTAKQKKGTEQAPMEATMPDYDWGLVIHMEKASLDKLGMKTLPGIGDEFTLYAKVKVTRVSESASDDGGDEKSVNLQITDMELES